MKNSFYKGKKILVTGGAGFIGSALAIELLKAGARVTIADNFSSGSQLNIERIKIYGNISLLSTDLQDLSQAMKICENQQFIFHLAANIGGRGYINDHPADCSENFSINQNTIKAAALAGVERLIFASSACVYPTRVQDKYESEYLLKEADAWTDGSAQADETYGWAKLMGELMLKAYHLQYGLKGVSVRYVTAYGPHENESHALIALLKRALSHEDPYVIWGSGKQDRDFTYVDDIVSGTLAAGENLTNAEAINIGTGKRFTLDETCEMIFQVTGWRPKMIYHDLTKPEGVKTRALSVKLAKKTLNWEPKTELKDGIKKTLEWLNREK